ncbi:DUF7551 domain-containing protein [Halobaculum sp. D14]|uniref:DUF7551 domain-containing protein n=1 Tax=Halobaculum sp. D14 TaxID=3421642 RepID=UPI003EC01D43
MHGELATVRRRVESLASATGAYVVACPDSGDRPVPVSGLRFADRADATAAARAAERFRRLLGRYDPAVQQYDLVARRLGHASPSAEDGEACHRLVGALLDALDVFDRGGVEAAALDTYRTLAPVTARPALARTLLWAVTTEIDGRVPASETPELVAAAAAERGTVDTATPVGDAVGALSRHGLVAEADVERAAAEWDGASRRRRGREHRVSLSGYALAEPTGHLPTLPLAVELRRRLPSRFGVQFVKAAVEDAGFAVTVRLVPGGVDAGLVRVRCADARSTGTETATEPRGDGRA